MAATHAELQEWFDRHKELGYDYMLVYVDEFDWDDYPVGVFTQGYWAKRRELNDQSMQWFMESYDLHADRDEQLRVVRVDRFPKPLHSPEIPVRVKTTKGEQHMVREDIYKKNGIKTTDHDRLGKLLEGFDARLDALADRADTIDKQIEPLYKAVILNTPDLRDELAKRVLKMIGLDTSQGVPPTAAQQPMNAYGVTHTPEVGAAPSASPPPPAVLEFECRMCTKLTDRAQRVRIEGHFNIFTCPECAQKLAKILDALLDS